VKRNKHTLSNYHLLTCDMGELIPVGIQEALPGDTFQLASSALIRVSPQAAPVMHPVSVRLHHFFVPHRLVWDGWEDFITGGPDGMNADTPPTMTAPATVKDTWWDYLGVPPNASGMALNAMPIYGLNMIYNEYYRDQDLQTERADNQVDIPNVGWGKDYFTTARPWTQKGPEIVVPLGDKAPIMGIGYTSLAAAGSAQSNVRETGARIASYTRGDVDATKIAFKMTDSGAVYADIYADLSRAGSASVNDFRRAFALQRYQEARARYGSRYTEYLRYLGVRPSDARLQRPEFLGGGTARIAFSEIMQTGPATSETTPRTGFGVGDLYGHGIAAMRSRSSRRFIEEHGYLFTLLSVRPKGIYMQGVHRSYLKKTKEDYWQRELEHIGQQEIYKDEIYAASSNAGAVFGYQDRYREYRETPSRVSGDYRDTLDYWHMARDLPSNTTLNSDFVKCVPTKRIYNVQTEDVLWCMINNHVVARRLVSRSAGSRIL